MSTKSLPIAKPEEVEISSERLARIQPFMQNYIDNRRDPNFITMVVRRGKIVHYEAQGYMSFESKTPVRKDAIYRLWSNTKPITGVATMLCVEDGLLSLDDPISKFLPAFKNQRVRAPAGQGPMMGTPTVSVTRDMTIRDCLRNTTGLATARTAPLSYMTEFKDILPKTGLLSPPGLMPGGMKETLDAYAKLPLEAQPGTRFDYQVGYPIAGMVLMEVTGKTLEEFYAERIFRPLGMEDTSFYLDKEKLDRFPTLYSPVRKEGKFELVVSEEPEKSEKVLGPRVYFGAGGGGGGVLSTISDYARFAQMLLNGGELDGVRILSRKSVEIMSGSHTSHIDAPLGQPGRHFGIGVGVYTGGGTPVYRSIGTFGWQGAAGTSCYIDPKEELIFLCFTQVFMHEVMGDNFYDLEFERMVYQSLL